MTPTGSPTKTNTTTTTLTTTTQASEDDDALPTRVMATVAAPLSTEETGPDYLDVDVIDPDSAALPVGEAGVDDESADDTDTEVDLAVEYDDEGEAFDDEKQYEYIDDTSGIPVAEESPMPASPSSDRRHRYDADKAAASNCPQIRRPQAGADGHGADVGALGDDGVPGSPHRRGGSSASRPR